MIRLNSHLNEEVLALIHDKIAKYKLFYALYFKYYEERNAFFTEKPNFSRSLVTTLAEKLGVSIKINIPINGAVKRSHETCVIEETSQGDCIKPIDAKQFVTKLKKSLTKHLNEFNSNLPKNKLVSILKRPKGHIKLTPLKEQPELGKAVKSIFLCRYLSSEGLRREIHQGLNTVERWNGVNDFIFYGNYGVLKSNNSVDLELSTLCLHLLQLSMTLINTLMLQQVLIESGWLDKMTLEDMRAITPLLSEHINPYGVFLLDLNKRLPINHPLLQVA